MEFDSYIVSEIKTANTLPLASPPVHRRKEINPKRMAFTLAETLITLTIIGVIAAMTVPTLLSKYQKHTYVVGLKKAYSYLQHAAQMIPISENCPAGDYDCAGLNDVYTSQNIDIISKQFKTEKVCYRNTDSGCDWLNIFDRNSGVYPVSAGGFITQDGMIFGWHTLYTLGVDVNGLKGPNKTGRDQFSFSFLPPLVEPYGAGYSNEQLKEQCRPTISSTGYHSSGPHSTGIGDATFTIECTARVLREDAMNY